MECYIGEGGIMDGRPGRAISAERYRSTLTAYRIARRILAGSTHRRNRNNNPFGWIGIETLYSPSVIY